MAKSIENSDDDNIVLTVEEKNALQYMLDNHDRDGFYMTFHANC